MRLRIYNGSNNRSRLFVTFLHLAFYLQDIARERDAQNIKQERKETESSHLEFLEEI